MSRPSLVFVLAEDERQQMFVRRYLYRLGYDSHDIRFDKVPGGAGCGEQWVRQRYPAALQDCRARSAHAGTALVVVLDADTEAVARRADKLDQALRDRNVDARADGESVAQLVPKRHIETWMLCLTGHEVDEITSYKTRIADAADITRAAALALYDWTRHNVAPPDGCVPSLRRAIPELQRLERR